MAFTSISSTVISVGKAIKKSLFTQIKDNFDDHEERINSIEAGINKVEIFNFEVMGYINNYSASELVQIGTYKAPNNMTITEAKLTLINASNGSASSSEGALSIDLQKSSDSGVTWNTILLSQPTIEDGTSASGSESDLFEFISGGEDIEADDLLRVNVTSKKDTQGSFLITVYGDIS